MNQSNKNTSQKKLLENPVLSSLMVPIAIVLIGALIIFGVTKLLNSERSYKDLVREMHSKTFGNRWIAAYELSKVINSSAVPKEEIPWLVENLSQIYSDSKDYRTKEFILAAVGAIKSHDSLPLIQKAILENEGNIRFHALVALSNMPKSNFVFDWNPVLELLKVEDPALTKVVILTLSTHRVKDGLPKIVELLNSRNKLVSFSAALGLINFKDNSALPVLSEILKLPYSSASEYLVKKEDLVSLKLNVVSALRVNEWPVLKNEIEFISTNDENLQLRSASLDYLKTLKK